MDITTGVSDLQSWDEMKETTLRYLLNAKTNIYFNYWDPPLPPEQEYLCDLNKNSHWICLSRVRKSFFSESLSCPHIVPFRTHCNIFHFKKLFRTATYWPLLLWIVPATLLFVWNSNAWSFYSYQEIKRHFLDAVVAHSLLWTWKPFNGTLLVNLPTNWWE